MRQGVERETQEEQGMARERPYPVFPRWHKPSSMVTTVTWLRASSGPGNRYVRMRWQPCQPCQRCFLVLATVSVLATLSVLATVSVLATLSVLPGLSVLLWAVSLARVPL